MLSGENARAVVHTRMAAARSLHHCLNPGTRMTEAALLDESPTAGDRPHLTRPSDAVACRAAGKTRPCLLLGVNAAVRSPPNCRKAV